MLVIVGKVAFFFFFLAFMLNATYDIKKKILVLGVLLISVLI